MRTLKMYDNLEKLEICKILIVFQIYNSENLIFFEIKQFQKLISANDFRNRKI